MKTFNGKVTKVKMKDTVVVAVTRRTPHPLYKKLIKRSSTFKVSAPGNTLSVGDIVNIVETRPIAKGVHFKLMEEKAPKVKKAVEPKAVEPKAETVVANKGRAKK